MPRIAFEHKLIDEWYNKTGEGTSTFDVCVFCFCERTTAKEMGLVNKGYNGDPIPVDAVAEETGSDVPDIDDCDYDCDICGVKLTTENY